MISVFMPTIRTHLLEDWYDSLEKSCNNHDFEVVLCGPFDPPESITNKDNVKFIKDYGSPTRSAQIAALNCSGEYMYHVVDDILFVPNAISNELDRLHPLHIISMRYREGQQHSGKDLPHYYWVAGSSYPWRGIQPQWGNCVHFLMSRGLFMHYGGFDCSFEYLNHATHDLLFRIQQNEQNVKHLLSKQTVCSADWMPDITGDHAPIHYAQTEHDAVLFQQMWFNPNNRTSVHPENYKNCADVWERRFTGKEQSYEELS